MTVLVYADTGKQAGDCDHLKIFANAERRGNLVCESGPEGVAFEHDGLEIKEAAN